jgi:hypothetical protein
MDEEMTGAESRLKYVIPVCSHPDCPQYRDETFKQLAPKAQAERKPFNSQSAYTKHMRDEHNECTFPCDIPGCIRISRRGYFREDLLNHRRQEHPEAPKYTVPKRELRIRCTEPGCGMLLDPTSMTGHALTHQRRLLIAKDEKQRLGELQPEMSYAPTSRRMQSLDFFNLPDDLRKEQQMPFGF